jgi:hypothetical protein
MKNKNIQIWELESSRQFYWWRKLVPEYPKKTTDLP